MKESFKCERLNCTLRRVACGKRWLKAEEVDGSKQKLSVHKQLYLVCKGCPVGKKHAKLVSDNYEVVFSGYTHRQAVLGKPC